MKRIMILAALLLLTTIALAEPEDKAASFAAEHLPGYTFIDGVQFDETAMLLVEDAAGLVYFAGCAQNGVEWTITLSTPFPDWMDVALDTFHSGEGSMRLWTDRIPEMREYEEELLDIYVDLYPDGVWQVWGVNTGREVISFNRHSIALDVGFDIYGDLTIPLDITQVDWAMLPRSFEEAMDLVDTSRWGIVKGKYSPIYVEPVLGSSIVSLMAPGAPVVKLAEQDGMVQVCLFGSSVVGWILSGDLYPGQRQVAGYEAWCKDPDAFGLQAIILDSSDPAVTWYDTAHEERTAVPFPVEHVEYLYQMGWCSDACCCLLYSETLGTVGFVPIEQLPYLPK